MNAIAEFCSALNISPALCFVILAVALVVLGGIIGFILSSFAMLGTAREPGLREKNIQVVRLSNGLILADGVTICDCLKTIWGFLFLKVNPRKNIVFRDDRQYTYIPVILVSIITVLIIVIFLAGVTVFL